MKGEEFDLTEATSALEARGSVRHPTRLSGGELRRADFAPWVLPETEAWYDVFISYRQASESALANLLFTTLSGKTVGRDGQHVRVFLDRVRLRMGQRWDVGFVKGLAASAVAVPLLSFGAIRAMEALDPSSDNDWCDNVLVEWMLMLELHLAGRLKAIQPILIGKLQPDGTMSNFFTDGSKGNLKDAVSQKTLAAVREYAEIIRLPLSGGAATRTIKGTLDELLKFQTTLWWDLKGGHGRSRTDLAPAQESPFHRMAANLVFYQVSQWPILISMVRLASIVTVMSDE